MSFRWYLRQILLPSLLNCRTTTPILNTATFSVVQSGQISMRGEKRCPQNGIWPQTNLDRGALEMVHLEVAAWFAQDNLKVTHLQSSSFEKDYIWCTGRQCNRAPCQIPEEDWGHCSCWRWLIWLIDCVEGMQSCIRSAVSMVKVCAPDSGWQLQIYLHFIHIQSYSTAK